MILEAECNEIVAFLNKHMNDVIPFIQKQAAVDTISAILFVPHAPNQFAEAVVVFEKAQVSINEVEIAMLKSAFNMLGIVTRKSGKKESEFRIAFTIDHFKLIAVQVSREYYVPAVQAAIDIIPEMDIDEKIRLPFYDLAIEQQAMSIVSGAHVLDMMQGAEHSMKVNWNYICS